MLHSATTSSPPGPPLTDGQWHQGKRPDPAQPIPPAQEVRRGRVFVRVYGSAIIVAILAFIGLALLANTHNVLGFDVTVTRAIQEGQVAPYRWLLTHISDLGYPPLSYFTFVVPFLAFVLARLRLEALLVVASPLLAGLVGSGIKLLIARSRPSATFVSVAAHLTGYSFPSGHVIHYTTLCGFCFYVVWTAWRSSFVRNVVLIILGLLVVLVGPSRVFLGEHWPTDAIGAYLLAGLWLAGTIELHLLLKPRVSSWWLFRTAEQR